MNEPVKWEYLVVFDIFAVDGAEERWLDGWGKDRWELINCYPEKVGHKYIFKRPYLKDT